MDSMDSNLAPPCKKAICSENSRDSNVDQINSFVEGSQPAHNVNCEGEKNSAAPKMNSMENGLKQQSNDGNGNGTIEGERFVDSSVGKMEELQSNRHLHANGLNNKNSKVGGKVKETETENRHLHANGLNDKNLKVGGKVKEMENRHLHAKGLNDKNTKIVEKGEKEIMEERENRHLRVNGLNNKIIETVSEWKESRADPDRKFQSQSAAEWNENRVEMESKFLRQLQTEMESKREEDGRRRSKYNQEQDEWRNRAQSQTRRSGTAAMFSLGLVSDKGIEYGNRFVRINDVNATNPIHHLERVLRVCYQNRTSIPDEFGCIRRNPKAEPNPLLCNLQTPESIRDTREAVINILHSMLSKILEYQIECSAIEEIGSHRITRFDLVETEVIQERIKAILNGSRSGRRRETLNDGETSVYDEGMKDYIQSNRLLDYISEFLWKAEEKADRPVLVNGLNETKPNYNYDTYQGERVGAGKYRTNQYDRNYREETLHLSGYNYSPLSNSFRISRNRPQNGDEYYYKPSNLSESFNTHPANNKVGLRGLSPSQTIRGRRVRMVRQLSTSLRSQGSEAGMSESMDGGVYSSGKVSRMHETSTDHLREAWEVASLFLGSDRDVGLGKPKTIKFREPETSHFIIV